MDRYLGSNYALSKVEIDWENSTSTYSYKVETSTDNSTWTSDLDKTTNTVQGKTSDVISVSATRYVRVFITGYSGIYAWASFFECRAFGVSSARLSASSIQETITLYPNPATDYVDITSQDGKPVTNVEILNENGLSLMKAQFCWSVRYP